MSEKNEQLVKAVLAAQAGDQQAFTYLYENTYNSKYYIALKFMKNEQDAQDVLQVAYTRAFSYINTVQEPGAFSAWLSKIVSNTAVNMLREKQPVLFSDMQVETDEGDVLDYEFTDTVAENNPEVAYSQQETSEMLKELLKNLSPEQQMAVVLFHLEGFSLNDIAEAMECNINTAKSRLNLGRKNLRAACEDMEKKGYKLYNMAPAALLASLLAGERAGLFGSSLGAVGGTMGAATTNQAGGAMGNAAPQMGKAMGDAAANQAGVAMGAPAQQANMMMGKAAVKGTGSLAKTGILSTVGAKIAVAVGAAAVIITTATAVIIHNKKKSPKVEPTTELVIEDTTEEILLPDDTEEATEEVTEETTESNIDPVVAERAQAYYDMIVGEDGMMPVVEDNNGTDTVVYDYIGLVDFNGDGKEQLVIVDDANTIVDVYDYVDGSTQLILEVNYENSEFHYTAAAGARSTVELVDQGDGTWCLRVFDPDEGASTTDYVYEDGNMVIASQTSGFPEVMASNVIGWDGEYPPGAVFYELDELNKKEAKKINYDKTVGSLVENAGIDTSDIWKTVYKAKLQELRDTFYSQDFSNSQMSDAYFSYKLEDLNDDDIPELIGLFRGWDGYRSFVVTCSKYGTYSEISLARGVDMSNGYNYVNGSKGFLRTYLEDYDPVDDKTSMKYDHTYKIMNGAFQMVGSYEKVYDRNGDMSENWLWLGENFENLDARGVSEEEYKEAAKKAAGTNDISTIPDFVNTVEEIEAIIDNY